MTSHSPSYNGYRFPPEIISHAVWLYNRFCLSFRDTEDLLAQRGIGTVKLTSLGQDEGELIRGSGCGHRGPHGERSCS